VHPSRLKANSCAPIARPAPAPRSPGGGIGPTGTHRSRCLQRGHVPGGGSPSPSIDPKNASNRPAPPSSRHQILSTLDPAQRLTPQKILGEGGAHPKPPRVRGGGGGAGLCVSVSSTLPSSYSRRRSSLTCPPSGAIKKCPVTHAHQSPLTSPAFVSVRHGFHRPTRPLPQRVRVPARRGHGPRGPRGGPADQRPRAQPAAGFIRL